MEEPIPSWLEVHLVYNDRVEKVPVDPELILNCLENECLHDYYETYVKSLIGLDAKLVKVEIHQLKGGIVVLYDTTKNKAHLVLHRKDLDPLKLIDAIGRRS